MHYTGIDNYKVKQFIHLNHCRNKSHCNSAVDQIKAGSAISLSLKADFNVLNVHSLNKIFSCVVLKISIYHYNDQVKNWWTENI